jgi:hypothetical protein
MPGVRVNTELTLPAMSSNKIVIPRLDRGIQGESEAFAGGYQERGLIALEFGRVSRRKIQGAQ